MISWKYLKAWKLMERKLLDMMNQLFISEYNSRVEYGDKFQVVVFAHSIS